MDVEPVYLTILYPRKEGFNTLEEAFRAYIDNLVSDPDVILLDAAKGYSHGRVLSKGQPDPSSRLSVVRKEGITYEFSNGLLVNRGFSDERGTPYTTDTLRGFEHRWLDGRLFGGKKSAENLKQFLDEHPEVVKRIAYVGIDEQYRIYMRNFAPHETDLDILPSKLSDSEHEISGVFIEFVPPLKYSSNNTRV